MADIPYLQRGIKPVTTASSRLVSSSHYLNDARLRDWVAYISLKRNGPDIPPQTEVYDMIGVLDELRDDAYIEELIEKERKTNGKLDEWFSEGFCSKFTADTFRDYPEDTLGGVFHRDVISQNFDLVIYDRPKPETALQFFLFRAGQTHDLEHIVTGGDFSYMGELVPAWARITNQFKHLSPELAQQFSIPFIFIHMRYTIRTMLHYPTVWTSCQQATEDGMRVGRESDCLFMARYEDVFHLPLEEARKALGVRGAIDVDRKKESAVWAGTDRQDGSPS